MDSFIAVVEDRPAQRLDGVGQARGPGTATQDLLDDGGAMISLDDGGVELKLDGYAYRWFRIPSAEASFKP